jgi:hypothetical protein
VACSWIDRQEHSQGSFGREAGIAGCVLRPQDDAGSASKYSHTDHNTGSDLHRHAKVTVRVRIPKRERVGISPERDGSADATPLFTTEPLEDHIAQPNGRLIGEIFVAQPSPSRFVGNLQDASLIADHVKNEVVENLRVLNNTAVARQTSGHLNLKLVFGQGWQPGARALSLNDLAEFPNVLVIKADLYCLLPVIKMDERTPIEQLRLQASR